MPTEPHLTWSLQRRDAHALELSYTVTNPGPDAVWLLDRPLVYAATQGMAVDDARVQVRGGPDGVVRLVRGYLPPTSMPAFELGPGARELPAGGSLAGGGVVPWPLETWHPNDLRPVPVTADRAVLEVGYVRDADALETRALVDGTEIRAARPGRAQRTQQRLVGTSLPLP